ncbi:MAG: hypothetical protein WBW70_08360, partial [Candidatus Sulfotelmatobacter sp.]
TKLIAEAWDAAGLYQIGHFPGDRWVEWNGRYRDDVRRFVRGDPGLVGAIASRLGGSADIYQERGGSPLNSVNFVTCHDGFTLGDLVSFNQKHNEANGESNADGINNNLSWNCGAEGEFRRSRHRVAPQPSGAQLHGDPAALAWHSHVCGWRRNTAYTERQQQRILPG